MNWIVPVVNDLSYCIDLNFNGESFYYSTFPPIVLHFDAPEGTYSRSSSQKALQALRVATLLSLTQEPSCLGRSSWASL